MKLHFVKNPFPAEVINSKIFRFRRSQRIWGKHPIALPRLRRNCYTVKRLVHAAWMKSMATQRVKSEANSPQGQGPARVGRRGPCWTEFVSRADQAVVANAGMEMTNRAEPRAGGHDRGLFHYCRLPADARSVLVSTGSPSVSWTQTPEAGSPKTPANACV